MAISDRKPIQELVDKLSLSERIDLLNIGERVQWGCIKAAIANINSTTVTLYAEYFEFPKELTYFDTKPQQRERVVFREDFSIEMFANSVKWNYLGSFWERKSPPT